jgi:hypothetical protein
MSMTMSTTTTKGEFQTTGKHMYDEQNSKIDPTKIAYFIHPKTKAKCNVITKPYLHHCAMCHSHSTYIYELSNNQMAYFCECIDNGGQWVFSSTVVPGFP